MSIELRDDRGLIFGFSLQPQAGAAEVDLAAIDALAPPASPVWLHFNLNDSRARDWLTACSWISPEGRELVLSIEHDTRLEPTTSGVAGVLADVFADDPDSFGAFHFLAEPICLITGRRHAQTAVGLLHQDLSSGSPIDGTASLLNRLLAHLVATFAKIVQGHAKVIDDAEDKVLAGRYDETELGQHRRAMARLRRQVAANRHVLDELCASTLPWQGKAEGNKLRKIAATLATAAQDLDLVQERARLLNEEIDSRLTKRTNRNFYYISVVAAVFLPITSISGIFGMNVGGLPWIESPHGFRWVIASMLAFVAAALAFLHWRRML